MKFRTDFVTNSSSSSFLIVGTGDNNIIDEVLEKIGKTPYLDFGVHSLGELALYGDCISVWYVGLPIEDLLETMTLPELKELFREKLKKEFSLEAEDVGLYYGEAGNG